MSVTCVGCKRQQLGTDALCLSCIEDLNLWLRSIPDLYNELGSVRLPGSVRASGPSTKSLAIHSSAPVRLEVIDLLDRGEVFKALEPWSYGADVREMCDRLRHQLLSVAIWDREDASAFYRAMKGLCRDLGRAVGEPDEARPVGKCSRPVDNEVCRGQLHRAAAGGVYCRRCGDKPQMIEQQVWVTATEAALILGKPIKTVRNWYNRGLVGWAPPFVAGLGWLPIIVRRAVATLPHPSDSVNLGSRAEPSPDSSDEPGLRSGLDADVLGSDVVATTLGNVTPPESADSGTAVALDPHGTAPEQGLQYPSNGGEPGSSTAAVPPKESTSGASVPGGVKPSGAAGEREKGPAADHLSAAGPPS